MLRSPRRSYFCVVLLVCLVPATVAHAGPVWFVDDDAPSDPGPGDPTASDPNEDGSSDHPFDAIQEAINVAADGDEVVVRSGRYSGPGNDWIDFLGLAITVRSEGGEPSDTVIGAPIGFFEGETAASVLDGFLVEGSSGWGILVDHSSPTIRNCIFENCELGGIRVLGGAPFHI